MEVSLRLTEQHRNSEIQRLEKKEWLESSEKEKTFNLTVSQVREEVTNDGGVRDGLLSG